MEDVKCTVIACNHGEKMKDTLQEKKDYIDNMSYQKMLYKWRFASSGDPLFQGELGDYFARAMAVKKVNADHVQASKNIGWG